MCAGTAPLGGAAVEFVPDQVCGSADANDAGAQVLDGVCEGTDAGRSLAIHLLADRAHHDVSRLEGCPTGLVKAGAGLHVVGLAVLDELRQLDDLVRLEFVGAQDHLDRGLASRVDHRTDALADEIHAPHAVGEQVHDHVEFLGSSLHHPDGLLPQHLGCVVTVAEPDDHAGLHARALELGDHVLQPEWPHADRSVAQLDGGLAHGVDLLLRAGLEDGVIDVLREQRRIGLDGRDLFGCQSHCSLMLVFTLSGPKNNSPESLLSLTLIIKKV